MKNTFIVDFDDIESFIDNHFFSDLKSKKSLKKPDLVNPK